MKRKRSSRKNAWFFAPRLHAMAARKGWGRRRSSSRRRTRHNAGTLSLRSATRSATQGFSVKVLTKGGEILVGNVGTTFIADYVATMLPVLRSNALLNVGTVLVTAGVTAAVAQKTLGKKMPGLANNVLIGGILAGITRGLKALLPSQFSTCGLGEDMEGFAEHIGMDGMGDSLSVSPWQINNPITPNGFSMGSYAHVGQPTIGTSGVGDYAMNWQTQPGSVVALDGLADEMAGLM